MSMFVFVVDVSLFQGRLVWVLHVAFENLIPCGGVMFQRGSYPVGRALRRRQWQRRQRQSRPHQRQTLPQRRSLRRKQTPLQGNPTRLQRSQALLQRSPTRLRQSQTLLQRSPTRLRQSQTLLQRSPTRLRQSRTPLQRSRTLRPLNRSLLRSRTRRSGTQSARVFLSWREGVKECVPFSCANINMKNIQVLVRFGFELTHQETKKGLILYVFRLRPLILPSFHANLRGGGVNAFLNGEARPWVPALQYFSGS